MVQHAPHSWFKGPHLGGVVVSQRKTNGCVETFVPANDAATAAWESLKGNPLDVLVEHSKFAGYTLRRSPRGREFCLNMFNLAFPREEDVSGYYQVLPSVQNGVRWALEVFARVTSVKVVYEFLRAGSPLTIMPALGVLPGCPPSRVGAR